MFEIRQYQYCAPTFQCRLSYWCGPIDHMKQNPKKSFIGLFRAEQRETSYVTCTGGGGGGGAGSYVNSFPNSLLRIWFLNTNSYSCSLTLFIVISVLRITGSFNIQIFPNKEYLHLPLFPAIILIYSILPHWEMLLYCDIYIIVVCI